MSARPWAGDPTLYAGSAPFYATGRVPYPPELADAVVDALGLDATGRLLDVGCGPGSLTLPLAPHFAEVTGIDADAGMLAEARNRAADAGIGHATWRLLPAEELPADLAAPTVVSFAQSFHWLDRETVARAVRGMLAPDGAVVHVGATTHEGVDTDDTLPHPRPPRAAIGALVRRYLGDARRAGRSTLPDGVIQDSGEARIFRAAGFRGPQRLELGERTVRRTAEEVRASIYSLSSSAPHLFAHRLDGFDTELRALLAAASPEGVFAERLRGITIELWRPR